MKVLNDEMTVKTTTSQLTDDTAVDSGGEQNGTTAYRTFMSADIEISNEKLIPFHAIDHVEVTHNKSEGEVVDDTCADGTEPPTPQPYFSGLTDATINQGTSFDLTAGVKAYDGEGNEIPFTVSPTEVEACSVGTQVFTYSAEGVTGTRNITVRKIDNPTINGISTPIEVAENQTFDALNGVTAVDGNGNTIAVTTDAPSSYADEGTYTINYTATDECGNTTNATRTVIVIDTTHPQIIGAVDISINQGTSFDLRGGVTAEYEGRSISYTVQPTDIDTCDVGVHTFTYTSEEVDGEIATATRVVTIQAIADPTISGLTTLNVGRGEQFNPLDGVSAVDGNGNTITVTSDATNPMSYDTLGVKTITYVATDDCGNETTETRTVSVEQPPYFDGIENETIAQGTAFDLLNGVKAYDKYGEEMQVSVSPTEVEICQVGTQAFIYTAGSLTIQRMITVTAISNPVISGLTPLTVEVNEEFDPLDGVSATDGNGNTITVTSDATNPMSYDTAGEYTITYTAEDKCGNATTETRTIEVGAMATTLYTDGTFIINEPPTDRARNITLHGAVDAEYAPLNADNPYVFTNGNNQPWLAKRNQIKSVSFGSAVQPTSMGYWFQNCQNLESIDWTNFDGSANTSLRALFASTKLTSFSGIPEMPNVETLRYMFNSCESLVTCSMRGLNSSKVTDTNGMFQGCYALTEVTLAFGDSNVLICGNMFSNVSGDDKGDMKIHTINNISTRREGSPYDVPYFKNATTSTNMFRSCTSLVGGDGTTYDSTKVDKTYACCDLPDATGYFTAIV